LHSFLHSSLRSYRCVLFIVLWGIHGELSAQISGISGRVTDSAGITGLSNATVKMVEKNKPGDTVSVITSEKGHFLIRTIPQSSYTLYITYSGYKIFRKSFFQPSAGVSWIDVGDIMLEGKYKELQEVVVEAPPITIKEDTIEYRAGAFQVKPNAMTEDLLKKLPGIQVDRSGNITAQGKQVTRIKVNGKDFFSGDPKTASRELPADMIDKVQVIDDYGDQASFSGIRDGEGEKVINLELKKDKNKGWFGRAQARGGTQERYFSGGNINYFDNKTQVSLLGNANNVNQSAFSTGELRGFGGGSGGGINQMNMGGDGMRMMGVNMGAAAGNLFNTGGGQNQDGITRLLAGGLNFRTDYGKKNSFYGSYVITDRITKTDQRSSQQNLLTESVFTNNTQQNTSNQQTTHRIFFNAEVWIDSFNYLKISPNISFQKNENFLSNDFSIFKTGNELSQKGFNRDTLDSNRPSVRTSILWNHRFRKKGRNFSLNTDWGWNEFNSSQWRDNETGFFLQDPNGLKIQQLQNVSQSNLGNSISLRAVYTEPLMKDRFLDLSYQLNHNYVLNDRSTFSDLNQTGSFTFIPGLSNGFENNFNFSRLGAGLRTVKKKYNYTLGLLFQPVVLRGYSLDKDSSYRPIRNQNIFPVARFVYNFSKAHSINFSYNGSAQQPSFTQLQPVRDVTNPQYQQEGNPLLTPAITHAFNVSYNKFNFSTGRVLFTNLSFSFFNDQIVNNSISLKDINGNATGAQLVRPENVNGAFNMNAFYSYSYPWANRKYVLTFLGTLNYNNNINLIDSIRNTGRTWLILQGLNFDFNYKEWLEISFAARYNLNKVNYSLKEFDAQFQESWTFSNDIKLYLPQSWVMSMEFDYTLNAGLAQSVGRNVALWNLSLEKPFTSKKNVILRVEAFDLLNQNVNVSRNVTANLISDNRVNRLTQYFMLGIEYRLKRFKGQRSGGKN
jgi:hypothetical protein